MHKEKFSYEEKIKNEITDLKNDIDLINNCSSINNLHLDNRKKEYCKSIIENYLKNEILILEDEIEAAKQLDILNNEKNTLKNEIELLKKKLLNKNK